MPIPGWCSKDESDRKTKAGKSTGAGRKGRPVAGDTVGISTFAFAFLALMAYSLQTPASIRESLWTWLQI